MDNVNEKWSGDTEIKSTGKWADKTIAELKKARSALKDKEDRTKEETSKLRQINFAIRSKKDWKGGVDEGDGSGSYGGQSPLSYDTQRSSKMKEEDDQIDEIAKLSGLGEERKRRPDADDYDDFDDEEEKPEDPDKDRVPHILMQVKKALDVEGDHDIQFENGDKHKFSVVDLNIFLTNYLDMKPEMREKMQEAAITGQEEFENIVSILSPKKK